MIVPLANVGSWKVTSVVEAGGEGNCMKTGRDCPASSRPATMP